MVGTRNTRRTAAESDEEEKVPQMREDPEDSGSDSDDAPEEVGFTASKKARHRNILHNELFG